MALPVFAIVGRPNVGKSTLFNALTGTRDALVADYPGLTRDRLYGYAAGPQGTAIVIDTGGLTREAAPLAGQVAKQVTLAIGEADAVALVVDGRSGPVPEDAAIVDLVRRTGKPVLLVVNKAEGRSGGEAAAAFYELGLGDPLPVSALRGDHLDDLLSALHALCPPKPAEEPAAAGLADAVRIAVIGRPNVGKSTLINRYLGEERLLTMDEAGTTRDSVSVAFSHDGHDFVLVDTAGIRRRARVTETIERFSVVKALQAIEAADAVLVLLDARDGVTEQDISLLGLVLERGRALAIGVNKWDGLAPEQRQRVQEELDRRLDFLEFADRHFISARHGTAIYDLLASGRAAALAASRELPTPALNQVLKDAVAAYPTPIANRSRIKLTYAHQGGRRPPLVVIHGNQVTALPESYKRYLVGCLRKAFRLRGTPVRIELRAGRNPFAGKRNTLTPRQIKRRRRVRGGR
ncbi:MAG: ribosome biogenesis GTPase Der [Chromatiales bacterium]|jgi:GTP-binding protein|nr:ribosome biogenesis GTPase Der [Chromatiales bacterium]